MHLFFGAMYACMYIKVPIAFLIAVLNATNTTFYKKIQTNYASPKMQLSTYPTPL